MQDLRLAVRLIWTQRWFAAAVIATLALGIGINTTAFTLVNAVLFKPVPFRDGERLVVIGSQRTRSNQPQTMNVSWLDYVDLGLQATSFETLEATSMGVAVLSETDMPAERYRLARTTAGFFGMLRTSPVLGRVFAASDDEPGAPPVAVIGYQVWQSRYGGSSGVIGRQIRVNEQPATIIGVMPDGFRMPNREDVWIPLGASLANEARDVRGLLVFGLLKPGVTIPQASADLDVVAKRLAATYPDTNRDLTMRVQTFHERFNGGEVRVVFLLMLGAVALVLLVACANVANMMLGRALTRQREMSVRLALGATRGRLVSQLLVESLLMAMIGGLIGLVMAKAGVEAFDLAVANAGKPSWIHFTLEYSVLGYCLALCVLSAVVSGLVPALRSSRVDLTSSLKEGGRSGTGRGGWLAGTLVVAQFTLALVLVAGATLMIRSLVASQVVNSDMPRQEIMTARVTLPRERYGTPEARLRFFDDVIARMARIPGAAQVAVLSQVPGLGEGVRQIEFDGVTPDPSAERPGVRAPVVSPGYFRMFDIAIVRGRLFDDRDGIAGREATVVTQEFVRKFWPGQDPMGKRVRLMGFGKEPPGPWMTVVGVSSDMVQGQQETRPEAVLFVPYRQGDVYSSLLMAVRASGDVAALAGPIRSVVQAIDLDLALYDVRTFYAAVQDSRLFFRVFAVVFSVFGAVALIMAAVGLYAVMAQATARRTREIGIRMALGATPARILRTVMRRGLVQLSIGLALGLTGAYAATGTMRTLLFGIVPSDPISFATASFVLLSAGVLACWLPAWRATKVVPVRALGTEGA
jgi:predicted permease